MTIRIAKKKIIDHILASFGRKRRVIIPPGTYDRFGPFSYVLAKREGFLRTFLRSIRSLCLKNACTKHPKRHEVLFCHDLLAFLKWQFPKAQIGDNLQGRSRCEFFFIHNNAFYLVEAKSEAETEGSKHPGWQGSFQEARNKIKSLGIENRYNKWLLYLAQLNDYASHNRHHSLACNCDRRYVMLGLPLSMLSDCKRGIEMAAQSSAFSKLSYDSGQDICRQIAYLLVKEENLAVFFGVKTEET